MTVAGAVADELIAHAAIVYTDAGWLLSDGTHTTDPAVALTSSLVAIADKSRDGRVIEISADVINEVRVGLNALLAERSVPSRREERARALLDVVGSEAGAAPADVDVDLHQHRLTLLAALYARINTLGDSEEEDRLLWMLCGVIDTIDRRADSSWSEGEGDW